ncbi:MAG: RHS repeat-associated core domain-containing protein, partial [Thermodesulfobacteriota bacterium]|nr:RHS repeat-associated core domain-containing protein [Thermodesulfobacteriota bacterium]
GGDTVISDYLYDGGGSRAKKSIQGGSVTYYIGAHFEVKDGVATKYIFGGNMRVASITPTATYDYHKDHLGSTASVTDAAGAKVEETQYLPFGGQADHAGVVVGNHKFTDQELDPETGLYNYNARLYDPVIGRFISADPIVPDFSNPQALNRYSYCVNNPLVYVDPSGHDFGLSVFIGAVLGSVISGAQSDWDLGSMALGAVTGAISGGIFHGAGSIISSAGLEGSLAAVAIHAGAGAISGGINSAITGGDIGMGMLTGAVAGGIGYASGIGLNKLGVPTESIPQQLVCRTIIGGISGGIVAEMYGGSFGDGFGQGAWTSAFGYMFNELMHGGIYNENDVLINELGLEPTNLIVKIALTVSGVRYAPSFFRILSGKFLFNVGKVMGNPNLLSGRSPKWVEGRLGNTPNWRVGTLGKGSHKGQGWAMREYTSSGNLTGRQIRWHPGGGHHGPEPYWRVVGPQGKSAIIR